MDLRRLKTIFIFVMIAINLMLLMVLYNAENHENEEKKIMTQNVSGLLAKNMIYLPETIEVPDSPDIYNFYLEKMFGSDRDMIEKFLGKDFSNIGGGKYKSELGTLTVDGDEFKFYKAEPDDSVSDFSADAIEKICRREMEELGMVPDVYEFNGFNFVENGTRAIFTVKRDNEEFFDAYISFDISDKGVFGVSGRNIISELTASGGTAPYYNVISILADLVKNEALDKQSAHTIVSIKPGYYIGKSAQSYQNILAIPVWQIATDGGVILHYDARNGSVVEE